MMRLWVAFVLVLMLASSAFAGEYLMNDTCDVVTGLRVVFSKPVTITGYGDFLMTVEPQGESSEFVFSGGEVEAWGGHWLNWESTSVTLLSYEWLKSAPVSPTTATTGGMPEVPNTPIIEGDILNPAYFAHPAYVMQGVDDRDKIFALPLTGVPKLAFYPVVETVDAGTLVWSVEVSHPEGIGTEIVDDILYIWGNNLSWSGHGQVHLEVTSHDGRTGSATIPVTVFRSDKTLTNADGKKDYFVPWSPQLDINRILSVEEHMRKYNRDEGFLDQTIRFSKWERMQPLRGAVIVGWVDVTNGTPAAWVLARVDETYRELRRIGCDAVSIWRRYYMESQTAACPTEVFDHWTPGLSMTNEEISYAINEAHRQGFRVLLTPDVAETMRTGRFFLPPSIDGWFDCYSRIVCANADLTQRTGTDFFTIANNLMPEAFNWRNEHRFHTWIQKMSDLLHDVVRPAYGGPVAHMPGGMYLSDGLMAVIPFLEEIDIVGVNSNFLHLVNSSDPTFEEVRSTLKINADRYYIPVHERLQKPMFVNEGFVNSCDGELARFDGTGAIPEDAVYDGDEQAMWYRAWFEVEKEYPFLFGFGWTGWSYRTGGRGIGDCGWTARLKPAEIEIARAYGAPNPFSAVWIDGSSSDWIDSELTLEDPLHDERSPGPDLLRMSIKRDDAYTYLAIWLSASASPGSSFAILVDTNHDGRGDIPIGVFSVGHTPGWMATIAHSPMNWKELTGILDVNADDSNTFFELRIPFSFLTADELLAFQAVLADRIGSVDETGWLEVPPNGH